MRFPKIEHVYCSSRDDGGLLRLWTVSITHYAWCGHLDCGLEYDTLQFTSGEAALRFINGLPKSWEKHYE